MFQELGKASKIQVQVGLNFSQVSFLHPSLFTLFTVSGPALPVSAIAGSDVVLDCKCSTDLPLEGVEVKWFRTRYDSPVHLYKEGHHQLQKQKETYRGRTQLFVEEFINGNVSLRLEDVRVSDHGEYTNVYNSFLFDEIHIVQK
uniref:Ig-like domain-containing protein n=1 Tax=Callorhinchus milii TaxID=7868 RepID=A0A4W3GJE3_CALMI